MDGKPENRKIRDLDALITQVFLRSQRTAPVGIQFGYTTKTGYVMNEAVVITDCAPAIVTTIKRAIDSMDLKLSLRVAYGGLIID